MTRKNKHWQPWHRRIPEWVKETLLMLAFIPVAWFFTSVLFTF